MESQLHRAQGHAADDQDPQHAGLQSVVEDEGDHHQPEKKSMLNKVRAKAKKIKDTFTKHGQGQEHEQERDGTHDDHDEDEEEEEYEEMVEDPKVHGAPKGESTAITSAIPAQRVNLEKPTSVEEERYDAQRTDKLGTTGPVLQGKSGENLGRPSAMEVVHAPEDKDIPFPPEKYGTKGVPGARKAEENVGQQGSRSSALEGLEKDPDSPNNQPGAMPPSNYDTKVADPTGKGGQEIGITPLQRSFDKMSVCDESEAKSGAESMSHDQFATQKKSTEDEFDPKTSSPKSYDPSKPEDLPHDTATVKSPRQSGYVEKISVATSIIADKAIFAKNVVASKLGYGGTGGAKALETGESTDAAKSAASPTEDAPKVAATFTEKLAPVYEKVADAGSSVMSKVKGSTKTGCEEAERSGGKVPDKGGSLKEYLVEKFKPGEEDKALSEVISDTLHKKEEVAKTGESKPMGKVTESEEVARHLGTGMEGKREGDDARAAGRESNGKGVVDRLKGAVSSWISKGGEEHHSQGSPDSSNVINEGSTATGELGHQPGNEERRLQESGN